MHAQTCIVYEHVCVFNLEREISLSVAAANVTVKLFCSCLKVFEHAFCLRRSGRELVWCSYCSFSLLSSVFPTHAHKSTPSISLSCGWRSVKSHLSSWKGTGSTKFPFLHVEPSRHRMEWQKHGTARLDSPQTNRWWICMHGPAALTLTQLIGLTRAF